MAAQMEEPRGSNLTISSSDAESGVGGIELQNLTRGAEGEPSEISHVINSDIEMRQTMEGPADDNDHIAPDVIQREAEVSRSSILSTGAQGPNVNGNIEEANLPVVTIIGPVHHIIQPAYNLIREQVAENEAFSSTSQAIGRANGVEIEQMQVVFTLKNPSQPPTNPSSVRPEQNNDHIVDIPNDELERLERMRKLYHAATTGDWNAAEQILQEAAEQRSALLSSPVLSVTRETALHIAAGAKQVKFVEKLLQEDRIGDFIAARDASNNTALCTAAAAGASEIVRKLWNENNNLISATGGKNMTPAYIAAAFGHEDIASELYSQHIRQSALEDHDKIHLFFACINNEMFELASTILRDSSSLKLDYRRDSNSETVLHVLARKPSIFTSQRQGIFNQILHLCPHCTSVSNSRSLQDKASEFLEQVISELKKRDRNVLHIVKSPRHLLFEAAALGNYKFVAKLLRSFPDLIWEKDGNGQSIFHTAILRRKLDVFELIFGTGVLQSVIQAWEDETTGNNILHFAAKLPPNDVLNSLAGEAFQMQKEVLFFKKLQRFVPAVHRDRANKYGKTPKQVFTLAHEELRQKGEKWMKKNASYCLLVATLIVTVAYPASSIIPGGSNDNNKGFNIHHKGELTSVLVTNAIAMGLSTTSMIMFFSVLISRFAEEDFISSLPRKFKFGLASLIVALVCMMVSFLIATVETCVNIKRSS